MDWQRSFLIGSMLVVIYMLFLEWDGFQAKQSPIVNGGDAYDLVVPEIPVADSLQADQLIENTKGNEVPLVVPIINDATNFNDIQAKDRVVVVTTDVFRVHIDTHGGDIVRVELLKHLKDIRDKDTPFILLNRTASSTYVAQSGLIGVNGTDTDKGRPVFETTASQYQLLEGQNSLDVQLVLEDKNIKIVKVYTFNRTDYLIGLEYKIFNESSFPWEAGLYGQIKRVSQNPADVTALGMQPFLGAALTTNEKNYQAMQQQPTTTVAEEVVNEFMQPQLAQNQPTGLQGGVPQSATPLPDENISAGLSGAPTAPMQMAAIGGLTGYANTGITSLPAGSAPYPANMPVEKLILTDLTY